MTRNNQRYNLTLGNRPGLGWRPNRGNFVDRRNQLGGLLNVAYHRRGYNWGGPNRRFYDWQAWNSPFYWRHRGWMGGYWNIGGWGGRWPNYWGRYPLVGAFGISPWGVNYVGFNFGYYNYNNPYYNAPVAFYGGSTYDYSQPLIVQNQIVPNQVAVNDQPPPQVDETSPPQFDQARTAFMNGDYQQALQLTEEALGQAPKDAILHEFRALALFALGRYDDAAAPLYSVLAVGPGWDWATMAGLYPSVDVYTQQLRTLEDSHRQNPDSAALSFVLAYHYLTAGHMEAAAGQLDNVLRINPQDLVAKRLLSALPSDETEAAPAPGAQVEQSLAAPDLPEITEENSLKPEPFYGTWTATSPDGAEFNLAMHDDGKFEWTSTRGSDSQSVEGVFAVEGQTLAMEPNAGGVMLGSVTDPSSGEFKFTLVGGLQDDPGLDFHKAQ